MKNSIADYLEIGDIIETFSGKYKKVLRINGRMVKARESGGGEITIHDRWIVRYYRDPEAEE